MPSPKRSASSATNWLILRVTAALPHCERFRRLPSGSTSISTFLGSPGTIRSRLVVAVATMSASSHLAGGTATLGYHNGGGHIDASPRSLKVSLSKSAHYPLVAIVVASAARAAENTFALFLT